MIALGSRASELAIQFARISLVERMKGKRTSLKRHHLFVQNDFQLPSSIRQFCSRSVGMCGPPPPGIHHTTGSGTWGSSQSTHCPLSLLSLLTLATSKSHTRRNYWGSGGWRSLHLVIIHSERLIEIIAKCVISNLLECYVHDGTVNA